jgi:uncharacterized protein YndB with AHSA1/START domain
MNRNLKFERYYRHSPARVWQALTDSKVLARWYLDNDFRPIVGHQFTFRATPESGLDGILSGRVVFVDEPYQLIYTFCGSFMKYETTVKWTLAPDGIGTRLTLQHNGFTGLSEAAVNAVMHICPSQFLYALSNVLDMTFQVAESEMTP